jgi:hypothetical protein
LVAVLVTAEARRHPWKDGIGPRFCDLDVAPHAVSVRCRHVPTVIEPEPRARIFHGSTDVGFAMAIHARTLVVRLAVAAPAARLRRKVQGASLARGLQPSVAFDAVNPLETVRAMLERVRGEARADPEDARASRQRDRQKHERRQTGLHGVS